MDQPADFDAFWAAGKEALAKLPVDAKLVPMPEVSNGKVDCWHVSLQNVGPDTTGTSRFFGVLCEPKGDGPFPALLQVPGAGVRAYRGGVEMAEKGIITFQVGIHGLPVNLDPTVYEALGAGALQGYPTFNLDERDRYYYRRVYLGCVRANDFLTSRPRFDGKNLGVTGGSQGGALSIVTAGLDPRVKLLAAYYPALSDVTGYLNGRAGGWPHMFRDPKRRLAGANRQRRLLRRRELRPARERAGPLLLGLQRRGLPAHLHVRGVRRDPGREVPAARARDRPLHDTGAGEARQRLAGSAAAGALADRARASHPDP